MGLCVLWWGCLLLCLGVPCPTWRWPGPPLQTGRDGALQVTRNGLSAKPVVFLNLEFRKPVNEGAQAIPFEKSEAQESVCGLLPAGKGAGWVGRGP